MACALIDKSTNLVVNLIVADPAVDQAPDGFLRREAPDFVHIGSDYPFVPPVGLAVEDGML